MKVETGGIVAITKPPADEEVDPAVKLYEMVRGIEFWRHLCCCLQREGLERRRKEEEEDGHGNAWDFIFDINTLRIATNNFAEDHMLGHGGFGPVYKGKLADGRDIAVKKLSINSRQGLKEFTNEVKLLLRIQHRNLVVLMGCCANRGEEALVYEFLPNKSLDKFLFGDDPFLSFLSD